MWVVKLGGSLAADPLLRDWLDVLAQEGRGRVIVVPGGGPFADRVRDAQSHWRFDEGAAHRMAILAMEQYALMLAAIEPRLLPASRPEALYAVLKREQVAVWLPAAMLARAEEIPPGWDVSSDSLAAWFAGRMSARQLVLVKSCELPGQDASAEELSRLGIVDPAFPDYIRRGCFTTYALNRNAYPALRAMLRG